MDQTVIMISQFIYLLNMYLPFIAGLLVVFVVSLFVVLGRLHRKLNRIEKKINMLNNEKGEVLNE